MQRFRIQYNKDAPLQYIGNLDLHKVWERYLRRARVPVAYTQGFHPQPKIQQAAPLPLGFLSQNDLIDVWVEADENEFKEDDFFIHLQTTHQPGIEILSVKAVAPESPSLPTLILSSLYRVIPLDPLDLRDIQNRIAELLKRNTIVRTRRNKTYDLRPLIEKVELRSIPDNCIEFHMQLSAREGATGRPEEILIELRLDPHAARYVRTGFIMKE
ncbi:MAG: TIGR03936 family radical SAM-associated protein [Chloroflexota bacterium]